MLRAFFRLLRAIGHKASGVFGRKTEKLMQDADSIKGAYMEVIDEKKNRVQQYMTAVGEMSAQNEGRMARVKKLTEDVERLEKVKAGALAKAKQHRESLVASGMSEEDMQHDEMLLKLRAAYADASSTLESKKEQIENEEKEIQSATKRINSHKIQLQQLQREIGKLKQEKSEAVADVKAAQFDKSIADTLTGISDDKTDETLEMLRTARANARGQASIAREVAGNDSEALENELAAFGTESIGASEFDSLISGNQKNSHTSSSDVDASLEVEIDLGSRTA